jgi:Icc-related predicted phosphoesterase
MHCKQETEDFLQWLSNQPYSHKLLVAGNHDAYPFEHEEDFASLLTNHPTIFYLEDSGVSINGTTFHGTPWTPTFYSWYFMGNEQELAEQFNSIPHNTDVLLTHGPAFGTLDTTLESRSVGSHALARAIEHLDLKAHIFGHIHESAGQQGISTNCSIMTCGYSPANKPIIITI